MGDSILLNSAQKSLLVIEGIRKELLRGLTIFILVAVVFLFLRLLLKLFGANPATIIVGIIYFVSDIILFPYYGIFPHAQDLLPGRPEIDTAAFFAIFCYLVLIGLAMAIIQLGAMIMKTGKQVNETVERKKPVDTSVVEDAVD